MGSKTMHTRVRGMVWNLLYYRTTFDAIQATRRPWPSHLNPAQFFVLFALSIPCALVCIKKMLDTLT